MKIKIIGKGVYGPKGKELVGVHEFDSEQALRLVALGKAEQVDGETPTAALGEATAETVVKLQEELDKANKTNAALNKELLKEQQSNKELSEALKAAKQAARDIEKKYSALAEEKQADKKNTSRKAGTK